MSKLCSLCKKEEIVQLGVCQKCYDACDEDSEEHTCFVCDAEIEERLLYEHTSRCNHCFNLTCDDCYRKCQYCEEWLCKICCKRKCCKCEQYVCNVPECDDGWENVICANDSCDHFICAECESTVCESKCGCNKN